MGKQNQDTAGAGVVRDHFGVFDHGYLVKWVPRRSGESFFQANLQGETVRFLPFIKDTRIEASTPIESMTLCMAGRFLNSQFQARSGYAANKDRKDLAAAWKWGLENLE